jgi:hypothetical protein
MTTSNPTEITQSTASVFQSALAELDNQETLAAPTNTNASETSGSKSDWPLTANPGAEPMQKDFCEEEFGIEFDTLIKQALKENPEALSRLEAHEKGIQKLHRKVQELAPASELIAALCNPDLAPIALQILSEAILPPNSSAQNSPEPSAEIEAIKSGLEHVSAKQQDLIYLETRGKNIIQLIEESTQGWKVSPEMLLNARAEHGNLDALEALKRTYPDAYADFMVGKAKGPHHQVPVPLMPESTTAQGKPGVPDMDSPGGLVEFFSID